MDVHYQIGSKCENGVLVRLSEDELHKLKVGYDELWDICNLDKNLNFEDILSFLDLVISEAEG